MTDLNEIFDRHKREEQEKLSNETTPKPDLTRPIINGGRMIFEKDPVEGSDPAVGPYECEHL